MNSSAASHVIFCITELDIGGAEKALVRIAIGLKELGWNVSVVSLRDRGLMAEPLEAADIPVTALECGWFGDMRAIVRLSRHLRQHRPAMLVCFLHQANIVGRIAGRWQKISRVLSGVRVGDARRWVVWTDRLTRGLVDHYIAVSDSVARLHAKLCHISPSSITAIPNGVDLPEHVRSGAERSSASGHRILYVGRLTVQKSPEALIEAFLRLPPALQDSTTVDVVGDGPQRDSLTRLIQQHGLQNRITLHGHRDDVPRFMSSADVLVLPSRWEGLPNVVLEAMAHGLPVIASAVDGVNDLIRHNETGWLVDQPASAVAFAETIAKVLQAPEQRAEVSRRGLAMVTNDFTWDAAIHRYNELLRRLSAAPDAAKP